MKTYGWVPIFATTFCESIRASTEALFQRDSAIRAFVGKDNICKFLHLYLTWFSTKGNEFIIDIYIIYDL